MKINKQMKKFKLVGMLLMSVIIAFTPLVANLNSNKINTVFADSTITLNEEVEKEIELEIKDKANKLDKKVYYEGSVEDNFTNDTVIIVLNEEETHKFKTYTPEDFPEIDCVTVNDLTSYTVNYVQQEIQSRKLGKKPEKIKKINVDNFRRILSIELREKSKENVIESIKKLEIREEIVSAEPNILHTIAVEPNEKFNSSAYYSNQWGLQKISAEAAWDITAGSTETVLVGVIDTGINGGTVNGHEDLINRMSNRDSSSPILHTDYIDTLVVGETPNDPDSGHGTFVAGIIGAEGNNNKGIAGVTWNVDVELVSLRAFYTYINTLGKEVSVGEISDVIYAINLAASNDIPILNYSAGGYTYSQNLYSAIAQYDGLFVAGAGNDDINNDGTSKFYPASYDLPNIIAVGATTSSDNKWSDSNYGSNSVDIFAPGYMVWSTIPTQFVPEGYVSASGTSFATPFVAGVAALIMSIRPNMEPIDIKNCILYSADTISALSGLSVSNGRLNAYKALEMARDMWEQPTLTENVSLSGTVVASNSITEGQPYGAFDGYVGTSSGGIASGHPAAQWTGVGTSGWIEFNLSEYVEVSKIYFYNRESSGDHRAKNAYFTGTGGVALGNPFVAVNQNFGLSIIDVPNVITNVIRLDITSTYDTTWLGTNYVGVNEIRIFGESASAPNSNWEQPVWTSSTNSDGIVTASGYYASEQPWRAYSGTMLGGPAQDKDLWSVNSTTGWLQLKLNYYIEVHSIIFYNGESTSSDLTKSAKFTGRGGVPLGAPFTAANHSFAHVFVPVNDVVTNVIQLNISSSYGSYICASAIEINATVLETQPSMTSWTQPIWTDYTNDHGKVSASGYYAYEYPWKAYNGTMLGGGGGTADVWTVKATSGWLELTLNYPVYIQSIEMWGGVSTSYHRTKGAYFTGAGGVALGSSFVLANVNYAYQNVYVGGVWTSVIRLNITSSYGSYISASLIKIHATC